MTWQSPEPPPWPKITLRAWPRILLRLAALSVVIGVGLLLHLLLRLIERPIFGLRRPITPAVTQIVCRAVLRVIGLRVQITGAPSRARGALVANHSSWLDIFVLNAAARVHFVSKAEVAGWPGIGFLARTTGTIFIRRDRREAAQQARVLEERLRAGQRLLFFPEGTSSDAQRVLPFKSTLFAAFYAPVLRDFMQVQPVTLVYHAPDRTDPRALAWWGDMEFAGHLVRVLALPRAGAVALIFHPPLRISQHPDRKALALACETAVRAGMALHRGRADR
ncbi:MAG: 1-acyl-sn-glycerol-3-phosphate acyltransferase [Rhodobacteraceae bacterium]|nr:MAG: 1-acyl-sn-glycerol-3-phosphate acyltransferase [Paracoccaceae bacterium]